ncbi:hypothetical protein [Mycobacteroides salmoniphilum]|uniref:Uncharacterized protein n=1 Tax=Mycobacteroides salmoniphilum TaxID=404941 RepID=A0A4R8SLT0_9MYCO|nr:hypothetical protein [Mycobacteroides salmoniphilum]TDZ98691.1 hypothetical protein CCUG60885_00562 [Mycobacteroides salmoniphilum]TEA03220.1 hypothetical protein CCUG60883_03845 [Mycobacteroides salmoniphilum]
MATNLDFTLRYDRWYLPLATVMGLGTRRTTIRVSDQTLTVKHGWAFAIEIPLTSIRSAVARAEKPLAWGVHASTTGWLVNGSREGIVDIQYAPPIKPRAPMSFGAVGGLQLSVTDPDGLIAALPHNAA